jgi:uncharacterized protein
LILNNDLNAVVNDGIVRVRVTPKSSADRIKVETDSNCEIIVRVYVTTVPEDGKANAAVIQLLAKAFGLPKSALTITHGLTSRNKTISISR